jgi:hypothetical protein
MGALAAKLAGAEREKAAEDAARARVAEVLAAAVHTLSAMSRKEQGSLAALVKDLHAAQQLPTNDGDLSKQLKVLARCALPRQQKPRLAAR